MDISNDINKPEKNNKVRPEAGAKVGTDRTVDPRGGRDVTVDVPRSPPKKNQSGYDIFPVVDVSDNE